MTASGDGRGAHGKAYKDKSKPADIRSSNISAAKGNRTINVGTYVINVSIFAERASRCQRKYYLI